MRCEFVYSRVLLQGAGCLVAAGCYIFVSFVTVDHCIELNMEGISYTRTKRGHAMRGKCKNSSNLYGVLDQGLNDYDIVRHSVFLMNSEKTQTWKASWTTII